MWVRATRLQVPVDKIDAAIDNFTSEVVPGVKKLKGNLGAVLNVDREHGRMVGLTYWADQAALQASEAAGNTLRSGVANAAAGATIEDIDRFEIAVMDRASQPHAGPYVRVNDLRGDPAKTDDGIAFVRDRVLPTVKALHGYQALICAVNRGTGRGITATIWETLDDLRASEAAVAPLRQEGASRSGATGATVEIYQSVFVELVTPAPAGG